MKISQVEAKLVNLREAMGDVDVKVRILDTRGEELKCHVSQIQASKDLDRPFIAMIDIHR